MKATVVVDSQYRHPHSSLRCVNCGLDLGTLMLPMDISVFAAACSAAAKAHRTCAGKAPNAEAQEYLDHQKAEKDRQDAFGRMLDDPIGNAPDDIREMWVRQAAKGDVIAQANVDHIRKVRGEA